MISFKSRSEGPNANQYSKNFQSFPRFSPMPEGRTAVNGATWQMKD